MASLEERVSRLEGAQEQMTERLNDIVVELRELRRSMESGFQSMESRFQGMESRLWWLVALIMTTWVTTMVTILIKG